MNERGRAGKARGCVAVCSCLAVLVVALCGSGCETSRPAPLPVATVAVPEPWSVAPASPLIMAPVSTSPPPVAVGTSAPVARPVPYTNGFNPTWVSLETWSQFHGAGRPERLTVARAPHPAFRVQTTNGHLILKAGSRLAQWNGLEVWLGFEPRMMWDAPFVHALDVEKNLQALTASPAWITKSNRVILIDPGHGGQDSGTKSGNRRDLEKHLTLDWALRLRPLLEARGWRVFLTRSIDVDVALAERVALADRVSADLFLSLHFNSATPNTERGGVETYCLTPAGMPSSLVRDYEDDVRQVFPNNSFDAQNLQYACLLHRALLQRTQAADHGVRRARFMGVLRGQRRPAVLIEGGYLSNPAEARRIASAVYRQALAEAVARALE